MPSMIYNTALRDLVTGAIDADTDAFRAMLVGAGYTPDKDAHTKRSNITSEVTGTGYTAGGTPATVSVSLDTANDRVDISLGGVSWASSTITAAGLVYYKSRGGAASADELVAFIDFGSAVTSTGGTFSVGASTLRLQN